MSDHAEQRNPIGGVMSFRRAGGARAHRANNFDFLRLIGALMVIYGHAYPLTGLQEPGFAANGVATIGVKIFFSISGYLVASSWLRDMHVPRYLLRRSMRIFPALIVVVLLTILLLGPAMTTLPLGAYFSHPLIFAYLRNIALYINYSLPGVFAGNIYPSAVNGSLWTLPAEFFMYLLVPILLSRVLTSRRAIFAIITLGLMVADVLLIWVYPRTGVVVVYGTSVWSWLEVAPYFLIGSAFALYQWEALCNIYVAFAALLVLGCIATPIPVKEALLLCVLPYAALSFGLGNAPIFQQITRGNDLSYGVYLFGFPVQQTVTALLGPQIGQWQNTLISTLVCLALAYLSWKLVERPALSWKPGRRKPEGEVAVAPAQ